MADNFISYSRFTALPPNISDYGSTIEEIKSTQGNPSKNPIAGPSARPRISRNRLFFEPSGSDEERIGGEPENLQNAAETAAPQVMISKRLLGKLHADVLNELEKSIAQHQNASEEILNYMTDSLKRLRLLREYLEDLQPLSEAIYARTLAASKK